MSESFISGDPGCEIVSSRTVNASREVVFQAWTDPLHLEKWWGPAGFTNTFKVFDLRPRGRWSFTMHGPGKGHYENECEFIKIEKPALITWKRFSQPLFNVVVLFEEVAGHNTNIIYRMIFDSVDECNKVRSFAGDKNEENFDRLENELSKMVGQ